MPGLQERRIRTGADAGYTRYLQRLQDEFPSLTILDARRSGYPLSVFTDASHVDRTSAVTLSTDVAAFLRADLAEGVARKPERWVELPKFRLLPEPAGLESIQQSIAWLESAKSSPK